MTMKNKQKEMKNKGMHFQVIRKGFYEDRVVNKKRGTIGPKGNTTSTVIREKVAAQRKRTTLCTGIEKEREFTIERRTGDKNSPYT